MSKTKKTKLTREQLLMRIKLLEAQMIHVYPTAVQELEYLGNGSLMGSGVMIQMFHLTGTTALNGVVIKDGLSDETIKYLQKDLVRSYNQSTAIKPKVISA